MSGYISLLPGYNSYEIVQNLGIFLFDTYAHAQFAWTSNKVLRVECSQDQKKLLNSVKFTNQRLGNWLDQVNLTVCFGRVRICLTCSRDMANK